MTNVLVTGGTGTLGREVVRALISAGHRVRIASRRPRPVGRSTDTEWAVVDYRSGAGLADALSGVDAVVLAAGALREAPLVQAVADAAANDTHLVYISIVGIDDIPMPYYAQKLAAERVLTSAGHPWSILRATQFHNLALSMVRALARPPIMLLPRGVSLQPIGVTDVAERLVELATGDPAGRAPDIGGPQILTLRELAEAYLRATARRRALVSVPLPGRMMRALADGANLTPQHAVGKQTFEQFLAQRSGNADPSSR